MSDNTSEYVKAAEYLIAAVTKPSTMIPTDRVLQPGDHGDVLALAQVNATLAMTGVLQQIADTLDGIRRYGNGQV
jgi:hypothetical protein